MTEHPLSCKEQAVYDVLRANRGRVISRHELARHAGVADLGTRRCDSLIASIRRSIGPDKIHTVRQRGWMLID